MRKTHDLWAFAKECCFWVLGKVLYWTVQLIPPHPAPKGLHQSALRSRGLALQTLKTSCNLQTHLPFLLSLTFWFWLAAFNMHFPSNQWHFRPLPFVCLSQSRLSTFLPLSLESSTFISLSFRHRSSFIKSSPSFVGYLVIVNKHSAEDKHTAWNHIFGNFFYILHVFQWFTHLHS